MGRTQIIGDQIKDGTISREDLNTQTSGKAVITKVLPGQGLSSQCTGIDEGTGDVTLSFDSTSSITWNVSIAETDINASINDHIFIDGTSVINITLPLSSEVNQGDRIKVTDISGIMDSSPAIVNRNGSNIMKLNQNFNIDQNYVTCVFTYLNTEIGWAIEF